MSYLCSFPSDVVVCPAQIGFTWPLLICSFSCIRLCVSYFFVSWRCLCSLCAFFLSVFLPAPLDFVFDFWFLLILGKCNVVKASEASVNIVCPVYCQTISNKHVKPFFFVSQWIKYVFVPLSWWLLEKWKVTAGQFLVGFNSLFWLRFVLLS